MRVLLLTIVVLFAAVALAQQEVEMSLSRSEGGAAKNSVKRHEPTAEQKKYGAELLEHAELAAKSLEGGMRAYALTQVARGYYSTDRARTVELLEEAFQATRAVDITSEKRPVAIGAMGPGGNTRAMLQQEVFRLLATLSPDTVDELAPMAEPLAQQSALESLLAHYEQKKQLRRAIDLVYRITRQSEFPYVAGARVMHKLPAGSPDLRALFAAALTSYREHANDANLSMGRRDLSMLIVEFWRQLPREAVLEAIDEVLKQTEAVSKRGPGSWGFAGPKGSVSFNNQYDYTLFRLLPVLKELDPAAANRHLEKNAQLKQALEKYPDGNVAPGTGAGAPSAPARRSRNGTSMVVRGMVDGANMQAEVEELQRAASIVAEAEKYPQQALAKVPQLSKPDRRAEAYRSIAAVVLEDHPAAARSALKSATDEAERIPDTMQSTLLVKGVAELYIRMGDTDSARAAIEKGLDLASKAYRDDTSSDDPNRALKAYWPSAEAYRSFLRLAGSMSPVWALELLKELPDPEIKATAEASLALGWLGQPSGTTTVMRATKNASRMSTFLDE